MMWVKDRSTGEPGCPEAPSRIGFWKVLSRQGSYPALKDLRMPLRRMIDGLVSELSDSIAPLS
jgi:hypothetical protein